MTIDHEKEKKFHLVTQETFRILGLQGVEGVSISKVSRNTKISRAWIYKYMARDNKELVALTLSIFAQSFTSLAELKIHSEIESLISSICEYSTKMMSQIKLNPTLIKLYFAHYSSPNLIGRTIEEFEKTYLGILTQSISQSLKINIGEAQIKASLIHYMRMGALLSFDLSNRNNTDDSWEEAFINDFKLSIHRLLVTKTS
jgi:hypothetical protein